MVTDSIFWTDSLAVLHVIRNSFKQFPVFVAKRFSLIDDLSEAAQRRFNKSRLNPADVATHSALSSKYWWLILRLCLNPKSVALNLHCAPYMFNRSDKGKRFVSVLRH